MKQIWEPQGPLSSDSQPRLSSASREKERLKLFAKVAAAPPLRRIRVWCIAWVTGLQTAEMETLAPSYEKWKEPDGNTGWRNAGEVVIADGRPNCRIQTVEVSEKAVSISFIRSKSGLLTFSPKAKNTGECRILSWMGWLIPFKKALYTISAIWDNQ